MTIFWRTSIVAVFLGLVLALGYLTYRYVSLQKAYDALVQDSTQKYEEYQKTLATTQNDRDDFATKYQQQKDINDGFEGKLKGIVGQVQTIDTLVHTDKELLQKYSKVYFLSENYIPKELSPLPEEQVEGPSEEINTQVLPFLEDMISDAAKENISLKIASAYRSFGTQITLKGAYLQKYGTGANSFSADQGYSEHQLGTAVDFTSEKLGTNFNAFESDPGYAWLLNHGYQYGFVLSYPKGNTSYVFEPWHWRFVGIDLATYLYRQHQYFYELDQRTIDPYLVKIFRAY